MKKSFCINRNDLEWIKLVSESLLDINIEELSDNQKKMLCEMYLENLESGMEPKDALEKALQIVTSFKM